MAGGTSADCNSDEIPDECQPNEDCNENGVQDICDIGAGTSSDCNDNLVPDTCDITQGTSPDNDGDGVPDECCPAASQPEIQRQFDNQGESTGAIANHLHLSVHTIDSHHEKIKRKLCLKNSAELSRRAVQWVLENG